VQIFSPFGNDSSGLNVLLQMFFLIYLFATVSANCVFRIPITAKFCTVVCTRLNFKN